MRAVGRWMRAYRPEAIVVERTNKHPVASLNELHELVCSIRRVAKANRVAFTTYAAQTVRKNVVGDGWATKRKVAEVLAAHFPTLRVYLTADKRWKERYWLNLFDAVALAVHHRTRR